jgi:hypothetical protein
VHSRGDRLPVGEALDPVEAAVEVGGQPGARLAQCPVEEGVMAAGEDLGALPGGRLVAARGVMDEPGLDGLPGEEQLASDPQAGDLVGRGELVDLAFLDAQQVGEFARGQEFIGCLGHVRVDGRGGRRCGDGCSWAP